MFVPAAAVKDYDPDQERDDHGRWTAGGSMSGQKMAGMVENMLRPPKPGDGMLRGPRKTFGQKGTATDRLEEIGRQAGLAAAEKLKAAAAAQKAKPKSEDDAGFDNDASGAYRENWPEPPADWDKGVTLFHGTSAAAFDKIKKEGLKPHGSAGGDAYARAQGMGVAQHQFDDGRKMSVYMTDDADLARLFSVYGARITHSKPVLLQVTVPPGAGGLFKKDEYFPEVDFPSHAVRFEGEVPPQWIKRVPVNSGGMHVGQGVERIRDAAEPQTFYVVFFVDEDASAEVQDFDPDEPRGQDGKGMQS